MNDAQKTETHPPQPAPPTETTAPEAAAEVQAAAAETADVDADDADAHDAGGEVDFTFTLAEREVAFSIDEELYALEAIYGACYLFIDRCYVFLTRPADKKVRVRLRTKEDSDEATLEALAGEFANELLNSQLRFRIGQSTATIREQYMARAFFSGHRNATVAELLAELDAEELEEEPLDIAVPWENGDGEDKAAPAAEASAKPTGETAAEPAAEPAAEEPAAETAVEASS